MTLSRREFLAATAVLGSAVVLERDALAQAGAAQGQEQTGPLTVGTVLDRIKQHVGVPWRTPTVDNVLVGDPQTPVRGVATTMMATFAVCKRAQALGCNFIITHETPFYLHQDNFDDIRENAVLKAKQAFLAENNMAVLHFHDHLHMMQPDGVAKGMLQQLGWESYASSADLKRLQFDGRTLAAMTQEMARKLNARTIRVVGDPEMPVHSVETSWGYCSREGGIKILSDPGVEVLICGETREWELVEYAQDAITAGQRKALVIAGHVKSEEGGMIFATEWLKGFVPEVPVRFVAAAEPFWLPQDPVRS